MYQVVVRHRSKSLPKIVIFLLFFLAERVHSLPCGFMRFHHGTMHCYGIFSDAIFGFAVTFRDAGK